MRNKLVLTLEEDSWPAKLEVIEQTDLYVCLRIGDSGPLTSEILLNREQVGRLIAELQEQQSQMKFEFVAGHWE